MKAVKGFTLVELMIVVAIIAILTSIAVPAYNGYMLRGKIAEAAASLAATRVRMEQYYQDNRAYAAAGCVVPTTDNFDLTCTFPTATTYLITATGKASKGTANFVFTLDQDNNKRTAGVPTGWTTPSTNNCFVQKKGGQC